MKIRLGRLSLTSISSGCIIDKNSELFPEPSSDSRLRTILSDPVIYHFFVDSENIYYEPDLTNALSFETYGIMCLYQKAFIETTKTVVLFHDGNERATDYFANITEASKLRCLLLQMGLNVLIVTCITTKPFNITDIMETKIPNLVRSLTKTYNPKNMIIFGRGIVGSILATDFVQYHNNIGALVLESAASDVFTLLTADAKVMQRIKTAQDSAKQDESQLFYDLLKEATIRCDNSIKLSNYKGHLLLIHSKQDRKVPITHADELFRICPSRNKSLFILDQGPHGRLFSANIRQYYDALARLCELLKHQVPNSVNTFVDELIQSMSEANTYSARDCLTLRTSDETTDSLQADDYIYVDDDYEDDECDLSYVTVEDEVEPT
jgi:hypothetical protein